MRCPVALRGRVPLRWAMIHEITVPCPSVSSRAFRVYALP